MPVECNCIQCGKIFEVKPYKKDTAMFCSRKCQCEYKKGKPKGEWITKICPSCGKEFITLKSKNKKYCSQKCNHERNEKYTIYNCDICGKEMRIKKSLYQELLDGKRKTITCSYECAAKTKLTGHDVTCDNCGKIFYRRQYHIDRQEHKFCSLECQMEYQHKEKFEMRKCQICGKEFECSKISTQRFCSNKCNSEWQKTIVGENNPAFKSVKIPCTYCGKDHYVKPYKLNIQEYFFCNEKCRQDWYANVYSQTDEWREKKREEAIKILESGAISKTQSKPQQIVDSILEKNNISFEREKSVKYYCIDNYLVESKLMIEVMGDYWHSNPLKFSNKINQIQYDRIPKDKAKHTYVKNKYNVEILYLWESDIYGNQNLCEKLILEYIKRNGKLYNYHSFNYCLNENGDVCIKDNLIIPYQDKNINEYKQLLKTA
nr:MAG TPA: DNA mismatch endonuclease [Caudoviricetes sp.]